MVTPMRHSAATISAGRMRRSKFRGRSRAVRTSSTRKTTGRRPLSFPLTRLYKDRLARCGDTAVIHDFYRVVSLSAPPGILLRPRVVARTLGMWR